MMQARLIGIARRSASRAAMEELTEVEISPAEGVAGDLRGKPGPRQVTVLAREDWEAACHEAGGRAPWTARRANLLLECLSLADSAGRYLAIGDVLLEVTGETRPCLRMDEALPGLRGSLGPNWRGGVTCRVVRGATVRLGDGADWASAAPAERERIA